MLTAVAVVEHFKGMCIKGAVCNFKEILLKMDGKEHHNTLVASSRGRVHS